MTKRAFSLIEISVVILVIGILIAGIAQGFGMMTKIRIVTARNITKSSPVNSIKDLSVWVDSISETSFLEKEANDAKTISTWFDLNNQSHLKTNLISSGNTAPTYRTNIINDLPAVYFNGSGWFEINHRNLTINSTKTIFVVIQFSDLSWRSYVYDNATCPKQFAFIKNAGTSPTFIRTMQLFSGLSIESGNATNKPYIISIFHDGANSFFRYNGNEVAKADSGSNPIQLNTRLGGSCNASSYGENLKGYIAEFIIFDRVLRSSEYSSIESYLKKKWGIKF